jgi:hypothetical protein
MIVQKLTNALEEVGGPAPREIRFRASERPHLVLDRKLRGRILSKVSKEDSIKYGVRLLKHLLIEK